MRLNDIHIRDPFILPVPETRLYYLYSAAFEGSKPVGFNARTSTDLAEWSEPRPVFRAPPGFWADRDLWAPEVHLYQQNYYLLASFKAAGTCRGTQILRAAKPDGPFEPISERPATPCGWECLDGTLYVEGGQPWMVFCHEWVHTHAKELQPDDERFLTTLQDNVVDEGFDCVTLGYNAQAV